MLNFVATRSLVRGAGSLIATGAALALLAAPSHAQVLLTLTPPTVREVPQGGTITFTGTLFNNTSAAIFLGGGSSAINDPIAIEVNNDPFNFNAPASLAAGASFTGDLFSVTAASDAPRTTYNGSFNVSYGPDANDTFASNVPATFGVVVTPAPAALPVFAVGGVLGLIATRRKKKSAEADEA